MTTSNVNNSEIKYCVVMADSTSNTRTGEFRMYIGHSGDDYETSEDYNYYLTKAEAEALKAELEADARDNGRDWACFDIESNEWLLEEEEEETFFEKNGHLQIVNAESCTDNVAVVIFACKPLRESIVYDAESYTGEELDHAVAVSVGMLTMGCNYKYHLVGKVGNVYYYE